MSTDFKPMLAGKFPGDSKLKFPLYVQPKLDGIRCCIVGSRALTRTLKNVPNREIRALLDHPEFEGLDGELIVGDPTAEDCYRRTVSFVMSEDKTGEDWRFYVFDMWDDGSSYARRYARLVQMFKWWANHGWPGSEGRLRLVPSALLGSLEELHAHEQATVDAGHEGVILRGPDTLYKFGRGSATAGDLLKVKRFTDSEAVVIGVYEELHNANEATTNALGRTERSSHQANKIGKGTLGGLIVRLLHDHAGFAAGTEFKIGTGFSAEMRKELWAEAHPVCAVDATGLNGKIAKFKHFEVGAKDKPRHPVFLGWRDERDM